MNIIQLDAILSSLADSIIREGRKKENAALRSETCAVERATLLWAMHDIKDVIEDAKKPADAVKQITAIVDRALSSKSTYAYPLDDEDN